MSARPAYEPLGPSVRVVVLCADPEHAVREPTSAAAILAALGCDVMTSRFDGADLNEEALLRRPAAAVVVASADELERGQRALRWLGGYEPLADVPILLTVTVARLPGVDFSAGASDFVLEPLVPAELYARVRQLDARASGACSEGVITIDDLTIDLAGYEATVARRRVELTHMEFELLRFLAQSRGRAFTREQLVQRVWGHRYAGGSRTVDIHVRRLRLKLGAAAPLVETVRNVGYKLRGTR